MLILPGRGYTEEPIVSLVDNCDQGYGAFGRATIDKDPNSPTFGQVTSVIITSQGENYPVGERLEAYVEEIIVENGGVNSTLKMTQSKILRFVGWMKMEQ